MGEHPLPRQAGSKIPSCNKKMAISSLCILSAVALKLSVREGGGGRGEDAKRPIKKNHARETDSCPFSSIVRTNET